MDPEGGGEEDTLLQGTEATTYRALCARLNYLSQDRPDIRFASKEASRSMAAPRQGDWGLLKRIGRYLVGTPRLRQSFRWQESPSVVTTFVDSDWAGCKRTCRSTSGGTIQLGCHKGPKSHPQSPPIHKQGLWGRSFVRIVAAKVC